MTTNCPDLRAKAQRWAMDNLEALKSRKKPENAGPNYTTDSRRTGKLMLAIARPRGAAIGRKAGAAQPPRLAGRGYG